MKKLLAFVCSTVVLFCTEMSYAMPSQAELDNVQPLVNELMGPLVKDFKAKKKLAVEVGDGAVELVAESNSDAAKFVLLKGAVSYYARAKAYDKAADAIESIMELVPDIPPKALYEITSKAAASATVKTAPRLVALNKSAQKRAAVATRLASVKAQLRKTPADMKLIRQHAELLAAMGKWETALAEFVKLGGEIGRMATADADAMGEGTELADFWWNYTPTAPEAKDAIRSHAANLYQKALDHGELDGLKRTLAERRITQCQAQDAPQKDGSNAGTTNRHSRHRYEIVYFRGSWHEAKADAEKRGGHLATITSDTEWKDAFEQCGQEIRDTMWLGATDQGHEGDWRWVTGEKWEFSRWVGGQPDNYRGGEHYLATHPENARWNDLPERHDDVHGYIMEYDAPPRSAIKAKEYTKHKYMVVPGQFTWHEAKADAERRGGHLATVVCQEEWDEIKRQTSGLYMNVWLGATDEAKEGAWRWVTGEIVEGFSMWAPGEPNNSHGAEHYLHNNYGEWNDITDQSGAIGYVLECEPGSIPRHTDEFANGNPAWRTLTIDRHDAVRIDLGDGITMDFIKLDDFWMGRCEVTEAQYKRVMNDSPRSRKQTGESDCRKAMSPDCPVGNVTWGQAESFCQLLNIRFKEHLPTGYYFSLPSAGQWQRATSGGGNSPECAWNKSNSGSMVHPVGTKNANAFGICDLFGNVWEWVYGAGAYAGKPPRKGGGCDDDIMSAGYTMYTPNGRHYDSVGFRLAIVPLF